jgi:hypothetical protein
MQNLKQNPVHQAWRELSKGNKSVNRDEYIKRVIELGGTQEKAEKYLEGNKLKQIKPANPIEEAILADLLMGATITTLRDELRDDPESYTYTEDDLETFAFTYEEYLKP